MSMKDLQKVIEKLEELKDENKDTISSISSWINIDYERGYDSALEDALGVVEYIMSKGGVPDV